MKSEVQATATSGVSSLWTAQCENLQPVLSAVPPEFMGPGGAYSPEDLFAMALLNCIISTFKIYAEKEQITFQELKGKVILTIDKIPGEEGFIMTQAEVFFDISGSSNVEKLKKLMDAAIKDCAVSNSVRTGKTFHINIS